MKKLAVSLLTCLLAVSAVADDERYTVGVIGTGSMGSASGAALAERGHRVIYGSRSPDGDKAKAVARNTGYGAIAVSQKEAAQRADIIVLAVPWFAVKDLIPTLGDLSGKIIVDITTADRQGDDGYPEMAIATSTSEMIRDWAPGARIVKTPFSAASTIREPLAHGEPVATWLASDDREAKEIIAQLSIELGLFPLDAGPLRMARTIDHLGFIYLTPLMQGRNHTWVLVPRVDIDMSCVDTEGWFEPVADRDDLAKFPNLDKVPVECPGAE